jgi:isocitrate lyase
VLIARTDADSATLLTSDIDEVDRQFCTGERTPEGFFKVKAGVEVSPQACKSQIETALALLNTARSGQLGIAASCS